ncbi:MAG: glycine cleavage system protein GcvH [Candidatus Palauibacterales bacterium]|nr:glycine cleavage system protein GcvH [Candidatus Palauibacterales bacterium]
MSEVPDGLRYTEEHEYVRETEADGEVVVGITDFAQEELGDVVFVELPREGDSFDRMEPFGTIEAVKAVSELYTPVSGEVIEANGGLEDRPELVNEEPYGDGWMIRLRLDDPSELEGLMNADEYREHIGEG